MEQLNTELPVKQEVIQQAEMAVYERRPESPLLSKVRHKFGVFGGISLIFGIFFSVLFYDANIGINTFAFTLIMITLLCIVMRSLLIPIKTGTTFYYIAAALLGLSSMLTSSDILQLLNVIAILILLDLSLLHQFYEDQKWDFAKHLFRMFGLVFQSIASIGLPFIDCVSFMKHTRAFKNDKSRNIFIGLLVSIPFLWIILILLSSADLLFGKMTKNLFDVLFSSDIIGILFMVLFGFLGCYCIICGAISKVQIEEEKVRKRAAASIAATVLIVLCAVYLIFCSIQIIYLFANGLMVLPQEFTFAEYARRGFFELLAVTILNIVLMLLCKSFFEESKIVRFGLTVITLCTYIMIASATYRMILYIGAYHLTFLRVFVLLSLLIIALVLAGVILSEYHKEFPLFRYSVTVVAVCYLIFSFSKPDYYIATYLVNHVDVLDNEDMYYLTYDLSFDAAPAVLPVLTDKERWTEEILLEDNHYDIERYVSGGSNAYINEEYFIRISNAFQNREIRDFNLSIYLANEYAQKYPNIK